MCSTIWISFQDHKIFQTVTFYKQMCSTMWISFQDHLLSRTVSNCWQVCKQKPSAAAGVAPRNDNVQMAGGDAGGETSSEAGG